MKFNEILLTVLNNTQVMKQKRIKDMYEEMQAMINDLDQVDDMQKNATERAYLKAFMSVMQRMADQLLEARKRYQNLDREKLKIEKCEKLAQEIKIFREECYVTRDRLQKVNQSIRDEKIKGDILSKEEEGLRNSLRKANANKKKNKQSYEKLKSFMQESEPLTERQKQPRFIKSAREPTNEEQNQRKRAQLHVPQAQDRKQLIKKRPMSTYEYYKRPQNL